MKDTSSKRQKQPKNKKSHAHAPPKRKGTPGRPPGCEFLTDGSKLDPVFRADQEVYDLIDNISIKIGVKSRTIKSGITLYLKPVFHSMFYIADGRYTIQSSVTLKKILQTFLAQGSKSLPEFMHYCDRRSQYQDPLQGVRRKRDHRKRST